MLSIRTKQRFLVAALVATVPLVAAGCGSSGSSSSSTAESGSGVAAAKRTVAPLMKPPTSINITAPLKSRPTGKTFVSIEQTLPIEQEIGAAIGDAGNELGAKVVHVNAGMTPQEIARAWSQIETMSPQPAAVLFTGISTQLMQPELKRMQELGIPVIGHFTDDDPLLAANTFGTPQFGYFGNIAGNYIVAASEGDADVAIFGSSQLPGESALIQSSTKAIEQRCPSCTTHVVDDLSPADIGRSVPGQVVSYLQQNPDVNWAYFAGAGFEIGVPEALSAAGLSDQVKILTNAGGKVTYAYLKAGKTAADLAQSPEMQGWKMMDAASRIIAGQSPEPDTSSQGATQIVTPPDVTFDISEGWPGFPGWEDQFRQLWGLG